MLLFVFVVDCMQVGLWMQVVLIVPVIDHMFVVDWMQVLTVVLVHLGMPVCHPSAVDVVCYFVAVQVFLHMLMRAVVPVVDIVLVKLDMGFRPVVGMPPVVPVVFDM